MKFPEFANIYEGATMSQNLQQEKDRKPEEDLLVGVDATGRALYHAITHASRAWADKTEKILERALANRAQPNLNNPANRGRGQRQDQAVNDLAQGFGNLNLGTGSQNNYRQPNQGQAAPGPRNAVAGEPGRNYGLLCYQCGHFGHIAGNCQNAPLPRERQDEIRREDTQRRRDAQNARNNNAARGPYMAGAQRPNNPNAAAFAPAARQGQGRQQNGNGGARPDNAGQGRDAQQNHVDYVPDAQDYQGRPRMEDQHNMQQYNPNYDDPEDYVQPMVAYQEVNCYSSNEDPYANERYGWMSLEPMASDESRCGPDVNCNEVVIRDCSDPGQDDIMVAMQKRNAEDAFEEDANVDSENTQFDRVVGSPAITTGAKGKRVPRPERYVSGLKGAVRTSAVSDLNAPTIHVSIAQLASLSSRYREELAHNLKLAPLPNAKPRKNEPKSVPKSAGKKARISAVDVVRTLNESIGMEHPTLDCFAQFAEPTSVYADIIHTTKPPVDVMMSQTMATTDVDPSIQKKLPTMVGNYYTDATVTDAKAKQDGLKVQLRKVLLDPGAMVNLVPEFVVKRASLQVIPDDSMTLRSYDGSRKTMLGYCHLIIDIAGVRRKLCAYVVPGNDIGYSLLLCRAWLKSVDALGLYGSDTYFIRDSHTEQWTQVPKTDKPIPRQQNRSPEIMLNHAVAPSRNAIKTLRFAGEAEDYLRERFDAVTVARLEGEDEKLVDGLFDQVAGEARRDIDEADEVESDSGSDEDSVEGGSDEDSEAAKE